jgi:hypothetical protein
MAYLHIYKNNPTVGLADGAQVSEGTGSSPISAGPLDANTNQESASIVLALRCDEGYSTVGNTTVAPSGATAAQWALSSDNVTWQAYGATLTITTVIDATNTLFYCKAKATSGETPANDISVDFVVTATVQAL